MKIYINGKQLDTYAKSVSVKKTNNLWKFSKAEFERTQTISVPATNNNKAMLDFADEFRTQSSVARCYVECMTELDGVVKPARLYVSGYKGGEFSCILTFGKELQSLDVKLVDAIKDSVIPDNLRIRATTNFMGTNLYDADGNVVKKANVKIDYLLSLLQSSGVSVINYQNFKISTLGIAFDVDADDVTQYERTITVPFNRVGGDVTSENPNTGNIAYTYNFGEFTDFANYAKVTENAYMIYIYKNLKPPMGGAPYSYFYYGRVGYLQFPFDIELRFDGNAYGYAVGFLDEGQASTYEFIPVTKWFGHYINVEAFTVNGVASGAEVSDDLSGTKILIPKNQKFVINYYTEFASEKELISGSFVSGYFTQGSVNDFDFPIPMSYGLFSKQFIPDITIYQLLQTLAAYKQRLLYFDGSKYTLASVSDVKNSTEWACKITTGYEVTDKAFDFAQHNIAKYKSGGNELDYQVNNVHLSDTKDILSIPFDGGNFIAGGSTIFKLADNYPAIGAIQGSYFRFSHISKIPNFEALLTNTRQVKIKFRMSYLDFDDVEELDCFRYKGALLQWVDLTWSDGWCTATLQTV